MEVNKICTNTPRRGPGSKEISLVFRLTFGYSSYKEEVNRS